MERWRFTREFKLGAGHRTRGDGGAGGARSGDAGHGVAPMGTGFSAAPEQAFPGNGRQSADQAEITRLKRETARLKAERDILKKPGRLREG